MGTGELEMRNPNYQVDVTKYNQFINTIIPKISLRFQDADSNTDNEYNDFITLDCVCGVRLN